jgi:hypothetical protein
MSIEFEPIVNLPFLYINGAVISNDATTPNTILDIAAGQARDQTNQADMILGNYLGVNPNLTANTSTSLNFGVNGVNGLDTGTIAEATMYYIYMIADPKGFKPTGVIASLQPVATGPLMPFGYGLSRLIGFWATISNAAHLLPGYMSNSVGGGREFRYDAPQATAVTAGAATSYTACALTNLVPLVNNLVVSLQTAFTANAAGDTLKLQPGNGTGDAITIEAPSTHVYYSNFGILSQLVSSVPTVNYKVSSSSDAVAINVCGYTVSL